MMIRNIKSNQGYTLIEMLVVLMIVVVVCSVVTQLTLKVSEKTTVDQFFDQVLFDIQRMQAIAMEKETSTRIVFYDTNVYKCFIGPDYMNPIFERPFPSSVELNKYSNLKLIQYNIYGNILKPGTVQFYTTFGDKSIIFNFEKGRVRFVE